MTDRQRSHVTSTTPHAATTTERPPYLAALVIFTVVFAGYVMTLAPTVTFWDAGEFIATAKILGIPHPPGTPLFVVLAHVWAFLVPIGEYAYRTNLMTATFSATAAALFFLVAAQALRGHRTSVGTAERDRVFTVGGAAAAAVLSAFVFTVWQNSNETEVYMVSTFSIGAICWLAWMWRASRGTDRAAHLLLLIVYLAGISLGTHLLTLLVGPALIAYVWHVLRTDPLPVEGDRRLEWAQFAVLAGVWALLIGTGLGSTTLLIGGGVVFACAVIYAIVVGAGRFALTVLVLAAVGASTYLFLYLRARVGPFINEADPSTWENLLAVIRREQYPPRSPLDNPIYPSGPDNPGRSIEIILLQIQNYLQYFDWQWANSLAATEPVFAAVRLPFTLAFTSLGIYGLSVLRERDRSMFWLLLILFLTTGPGLMGYMNFKPGFSLGWNPFMGFQGFPDMEMHEVRERDYFFTVSFQAWGIFAGVGLAAVYRALRDRLASGGGAAAGTVQWAPAGVLALAVVPFALNFTAASRRHGPAAELARDFAYDLLQTVEPYGIVFTNGDNDTFPLWYIQEVEEIRQDVSVVNLSLGNTDWYIRQLRDNPVRPFDPEEAPWFAALAPDTSPPPLHSWTDEQISGVVPMLLPRPINFDIGRIRQRYPEGTPFYVKDVLILRLVQENWQRRPIYFALTAGSGNWVNLGDYLTQEALAFRLNPAVPPDSNRLAPGLLGVPIDVPRTDTLVTHVYRYSGLLEADTLALDPTASNIATNLSYPFYALGQAYSYLGDRRKAIEMFRKANQLSPIPQLAGLLADTLFEDPPAFFADTPATSLPAPPPSR